MTHVLDSGTLIIRLQGDLLSTTVQALPTKVLLALEAAGRDSTPLTEVRIDMTTANLMDSAGLNFLVSIVRTGKNQGFRVVLIVAGKTVYRTLMFTRMDKQAEIVMTGSI